MSYPLQGHPVPRVRAQPYNGPKTTQIHKAHQPAATLRIRQRAANTALGAVRNALSESGIPSNQALYFARILLTRPGVKIEPGGRILYRGKQFDAAAFAKSNLAQYVTGAQAKANNQKAITTDPGYLQALASLGLARQDAISPLQMTERNALIQFGDPNMVQNDALTAGAAGANPFSTIRLLALQNERANQAVNANSNRLGTYYGGGLQSGLGENQRVNAAQNQDAQIKLQNLLAQINQQIASANQAYNVGQSGAQLDAYNNLLASGAIHAATPPNLTPGQFQYGGFGTPPPNPTVKPPLTQPPLHTPY